MKILFISLLLFSSSAFADYQWSAENPTYTQFQIYLTPDPRSIDAVPESADAWRTGEWTTYNTQFEIGYQTLLFVDYLQTRQISLSNITCPDHPIKSCKYFKEINPLLGEEPTLADVDRYFLISSIAHFGMSYYLDSKSRIIFQKVTIGVQFAIDAHNFSLGVDAKF